jgi:putative phosphoribosyl transferase
MASFMHLNRGMREFSDRRDAGRRLAKRFGHLVGDPNTVVLALPRGGVPVGYELSMRIGAPLDVLVVCKIGAPLRRELAIGAMASGGVEIIDDRIVNALDVSPSACEHAKALAQAELERREQAFRVTRPHIDVAHKTVVLVDDGLATGASMSAAINAVRARGPARVIVAVPVAPRETCTQLAEQADEIICLLTPEPMRSVGSWYVDFRQVTDGEVRILLEANAGNARAPESWDTSNRHDSLTTR